MAGDRLNTQFKDYVPYDQVVAELVPVFVRYEALAQAGESFGDFCDRIGVEELARSQAPEAKPIG
jgi:sulfite reductase (ferredoxin)